MTIRVCPKRDAVCPHGMDCPYVIDAYSCKREIDMVDWKPIETAPKDGTHVLLYLGTPYARVVKEASSAVGS